MTNNRSFFRFFTWQIPTMDCLHVLNGPLQLVSTVTYHVLKLVIIGLQSRKQTNVVFATIIIVIRTRRRGETSLRSGGRKISRRRSKSGRRRRRRFDWPENMMLTDVKLKNWSARHLAHSTVKPDSKTFQKLVCCDVS